MSSTSTDCAAHQVNIHLGNLPQPFPPAHAHPAYQSAEQRAQHGCTERDEKRHLQTIKYHLVTILYHQIIPEALSYTVCQQKNTIYHFSHLIYFAIHQNPNSIPCWSNCAFLNLTMAAYLDLWHKFI